MSTHLSRDKTHKTDVAEKGFGTRQTKRCGMLSVSNTLYAANTDTGSSRPSRSVLNLSAGQLERKRTADRIAQRAHREQNRKEHERKEERIQQLEKQVQELETELHFLRAATYNNISFGIPTATGDDLWMSSTTAISGNLYTNDFRNSFNGLPMVAQPPKYHHNAFHQVPGEEGDLYGRIQREEQLRTVLK